MAWRSRAKRVGTAAAAAAVLGVSACPCARAAPRSLRSFAAGGRSYVPLGEMASFYGLYLSETAAGRILLSSRYRTIVFEGDARRANVMGVQVWLARPLERVRGRWCVARSDAERLIDPVLRSYDHLRDRRASVVVLDPGHGGRDGGAEGPRGLPEKGVTLDLALRAAAHLRAAGLRVYLTRTTDRFVGLEERTRLAGRYRADVFVSIHLNAAAAASVRGVETYVAAREGMPATNAAATRSPGRFSRSAANRNDAANAVLGYLLQKNLVRQSGAEDRGVRYARFLVLRQAPCAAALVECAFLSNGSDERLLAVPAHREAIARAVSKGILDYAHEVQRSRLMVF